MVDEHGVLDRFRTAWLAADLPTVLDCLAADVVFRTSDGTTYRGRDEVGKAFAEDLGTDPELTIEPIAAGGGRGFGYWHYPTADDGSTLRGVDVYTVRDGLITAKDVLSKLG